ncbi:reprolysin-like metallopeptidase [Soonwooa sp.]|uniref:zinc-dependent metalloprotease n=1 Tax=Soonwooa sp. TaxID=1938592 RepID=UPI002617F2CF|nr:zinc-dependent metalloprotease family protein [Soonwooa sp.]
MKRIFTTLAVALILPSLSAQWTQGVPTSPVSKSNTSQYFYKLDIDAIRQQLSSASKIGKGSAVSISVPTATGKIERFAVNSFPVMDEGLASRYQLASYVGVGIDDPTKTIRFSVAPNDFQSMIISKGRYEFVEPATADKKYYGVHYKSEKFGHAFVCNTSEDPAAIEQMRALQQEGERSSFANKAGNQKMKTLRLAMSTTGEYTQYFGGVPGALAQINATITRVSGVFEQEFNVHLNVIDKPNIIFTDPATDPYSTVTSLTSPPSAWNTQLMNVLHGTTTNYGVGDNDFDIGHLFGATGGGGNAGCIGCVCNNTLKTGGSTTNNTSYKGAGITSPGVDFWASGTFNSNSTVQLPPSGDAFDIDYVAHEMGHQLGGNHTYSQSEGTGVEAEPGSGSTIMGYAGITGASTDVMRHSDAYFHSLTISQVQSNLLTGVRPACGVNESISNNPPVVTAMPTVYTIPRGTAFVLTAEATDPDGDALTYCWEQVDANTGSWITKSTIGTTAAGADFRSWAPTTSPTRYFPKLSTVLDGAVKNVNDFEAVSTVARTTNFRVTVRDNKPAGQAQTAYATQKVVVGSAAPFVVNLPSGKAGDPIDITWSVSGTNVSPYNVANVKIDYTSDYGVTWTSLLDSTPNNGSASVTFPSSLSSQTVIVRVSSIGNIFYAVKKFVLGEATLAVNNVNQTAIQVFPNPVTDILNVSNVEPKTAYEIYNTAGQLVMKANLQDAKVDVSKLAKGIYIFKTTSASKQFSTKFEKK